MSEITLAMMADEMAREIAIRQSVYPGLIARGKMREADARHRIEIMQAAHKLLLRLRDEQEIRENAAISNKIS